MARFKQGDLVRVHLRGTSAIGMVLTEPVDKVRHVLGYSQTVATVLWLTGRYTGQRHEETLYSPHYKKLC
jgi:hypothetical protein